MRRYVGTCAACQWEGPVADTAEVAAVAGVGHLHAQHGVVLGAGDVSFIRVWSFDQLRVIVGTADVTLDEEPAQQHQASAEGSQTEEDEAKHTAHKGRKGR